MALSSNKKLDATDRSYDHDQLSWARNHLTGFRSGNSRSCLGKWIQQDFYHKIESGAFCYRLAPTSRAGGFSGSGNTLGEDDGDGNDDDEDGNDDRDAVGISLFLAFG